MKEELALKLLRSKYSDVSDEDLVKIIAEKLGVELKDDLIEQVYELDRDRSKCYIWNLDLTDEQVIRFGQSFREKYVKEFGHDPQALHVIRNDVVDIEELEPETVENRVQPWLRSQE